VNEHVAWLNDQVQAVQRLARESPRFGIFGTSISGTWLYGVAGEAVKFFVDEDPQRIGRTHMGMPILRAEDIPEGADVFVPLIPEVAASVARRLAKANVRFHTPPQIGDTVPTLNTTVM
jgi:hypothetical protein